MLEISSHVTIPDNEIEISAIRSRGAGGQNVNKVSSAIHLRFNIRSSTLPGFYKQRLLRLNDRRITREGVIVIKAQQFRSQEQNREVALKRLQELVKSVAVTRKQRTPTRPTWRSRMKRLDQKSKRGRDKVLRRNVKVDD
ncbi:MAG: alternative ribosome rescue aminoacyl-tRNA hydrolase ArfB [Pseudomonadota bacterium]|nr:alternative ribosome rescue aminoacyl-tRNA hydrolase ArfB [Pseudomonadota bacterium]